MALKDMLVYVDYGERGLMRLRLAADLARRHGARLVALFVKDWTVAQLAHRRAGELGLVPSSELDQLNRSIEDALDKEAARMRSALQTLERELGLEAEWRCVTGSAAAIVPQHARYADLCIVGQDVAQRDDQPHGYSFSEQLLFVTGRPVVFIPAAGRFETLGRHIAVAWNSSRAAARSAGDALDLMIRADRATLLTANPRDFIDRHGALPVDDLVAHLERHGARVEAVQIEAGGRPIGAAIQDMARQIGADLLVAGAYGHPRLWEKVLGGVTRDLLAGMTLPLFMSY